MSCLKHHCWIYQRKTASNTWYGAWSLWVLLHSSGSLFMVEHLKQPEETLKNDVPAWVPNNDEPHLRDIFCHICANYNILWRGCGRSLYLAQLDGNFKEKGRSEIDSENRNIHHSIQVILKWHHSRKKWVHALELVGLWPLPVATQPRSFTVTHGLWDQLRIT